MKVRVYDKTTGNYFKSEVYARINTGWYEKQLVHVPSENGGYSCFFDYLDKGEDNESPKVLINTITPDTPKEWIYQKSGSVDEKLPDFEKLLCNGVRFFEYIGFQLLTNCKQLKLKAADGKRYNTNVANTGELLRIIQSIPSPKAESFKMWLAQVERERIEETIDPELTIDRALATYLKKGYTREWINQRLQAIQVRKELTDEWDDRGVKQGQEYAILTDEITRACIAVNNIPCE